jgi:thiamine-phosphate pyrophosphorylase
MKRRGLYAVTPESGELLGRVRQALEGGIALLQYRSKAPDRAQLGEIVRMARGFGVPVIVNDHLELALETGADGVHLGREDENLAVARKRMPKGILGASCYDEPALAEAAVRAGADYIAFGSVFRSPTKPRAVHAPLELFRKKYPVPLAAIGGITLDNAPQAIAAGADLLAVISDLFDAPDVRARALQYARLFG